jgi:hypothetical protein
MATTTWLAIILGAVWGAVWALFLQTYAGRFLAARFTWLAVVVGVGVDLLIALLIVPLETWLEVAAIIAASAVAIIGRSLWNEWRDAQKMIRMQREHSNTVSQQDHPVD